MGKDDKCGQPGSVSTTAGVFLTITARPMSPTSPLVVSCVLLDSDRGVLDVCETFHDSGQSADVSLERMLSRYDDAERQTDSLGLDRHDC